MLIGIQQIKEKGYRQVLLLAVSFFVLYSKCWGKELVIPLNWCFYTIRQTTKLKPL